MDYLRKQIGHFKVETGTSYKKIASEVGIAYGTLRNFMSGQRDRVSEETARKLATYLQAYNN